MRDFIQNVSIYAKTIDPEFLVIPQNGQELITNDGTASGAPVSEYINAIDGAGREDLLYGYNNDNTPTPSPTTEYMTAFLDICEDNDVEVLVIDYCWSHPFMDDSYNKNHAMGYISFAAPERDLNIIPDYPEVPFNENSNNIDSLSDARNFLYIINPDNFTDKAAFIAAVGGTNYDVIIMDLFLNDLAFTPAETGQLKIKSGGDERLVISYMSIGEAEDYRYYWEDSWTPGSPSWLLAENPDWEGNYKVRYWEQEWQDIIFGNDESYLKKILDAGFDGVYLDLVDAFEYFEN